MTLTSHIELKATQSKVHSVTVFQADRAEVVRYFDVELKAGQNEVDISQLPTVLDEDSIRVDGIGGKAIIADMIYHPPTSNDSDKKHEKAVKDLQKQKEELQRQLAVFKNQQSILNTYSGTLRGADTTAQKLSEFLDIYATRQSAIDEKSTELSDQIAAIDEEITKEREVWSADNEGKKRAVRITVVVVAEEDGPAEISVTYLVTNASWTPLYDLRASIRKDKTDISLQYRATIAQSTGEDWNEVNLTLSTASPQIGSTIPKLNPQWINVVQPVWLKKSKGRSARFSTAMPVPSAAPAAPGGPAVFAQSYMADEATLGGGGFQIPEALAVEGTMSTSFIIDGLSTIPSDTDTASQAHKVNIAVIDLSAELEWISVPKETPSAFLQAKVKNTSSYLLLPGRANIFLDDNFVAKSEIEHVSPNESFNCSLGVDPQLKVTYHPRSKKTRSQGGLLQSRTITTAYHQKVTIKNTRSATIKRLLVRDQIPVSSDQRIKVALVEPANLEFPDRPNASSGGTLTEKALKVPKETPISKNVSVRWKVSEQEEADSSSTPGSDGAREGMLEWVCEIGAGQSTDLTLAWDVTAPSGTNWGPQ